MSIPQTEAPKDGAATGLAGPTGSALFIPLKREYFDAFERGKKSLNTASMGRDGTNAHAASAGPSCSRWVTGKRAV